MSIIANNIKWIMIVSGLITCSMILAAISPEAGLMNTFGESIIGPIADIVVRSWGALITLVGGLLIYGAFKTEYRSLVISIAIISKIIFITLVLSFGSQFLDKAIVAVVFDSVVILLFAIYLLTGKQTD